MKKKALIPVLLFVPLLFMGNSPYPYYNEENYPIENIEISNIQYGEESQRGYFPFAIDVENKGDMYLSLNSLYFNFKSAYGDFYLNTPNYGDLVPPHQKMTVYGVSDNNTYQVEDLIINSGRNAYGYRVEGEAATYKKAALEYIGVDYVDDYNRNCYTYKVDVDGLSIDSDVYCSMLINYTSNDHQYAMYWSGASENNNFYISSYEEATSENISINNIYVLKGMNRRHSDWESIWLTIMVSVFIALGLGFLASLIVVPLVLFNKKPWRK